MNAAEITDKLGLHSLRNRVWYIQVIYILTVYSAPLSTLNHFHSLFRQRARLPVTAFTRAWTGYQTSWRTQTAKHLVRPPLWFLRRTKNIRKKTLVVSWLCLPCLTKGEFSNRKSSLHQTPHLQHRCENWVEKYIPVRSLGCSASSREKSRGFTFNRRQVWLHTALHFCPL